jgi:uncharacterized protein (DUF305 family)
MSVVRCLVAVVWLAAVLVACSDDRMSMTPMGPTSPGGMAGSGMAGSGMAGPGMGAVVTSEFEYLARMIPHHEEAVATAQLVVRGTDRQEMRTFARSIVSGQSAEIAQMRAWLAAWYPLRDATVTYDPMMRELVGLRGDALDQAFLADMIPHHMMAVMMSQQFLAARLDRHPETEPFARAIRDVQQQEAWMMQDWLRTWFR